MGERSSRVSTFDILVERSDLGLIGVWPLLMDNPKLRR
jgi:hypothetical protein